MLLSALPREGAPVDVVSGLWLPTGRLEGVSKGLLLRVGRLLPRQAFCQNPSKNHFLTLIGSTTVTHLACVSDVEAVIAARPFFVSAQPRDPNAL